MRNGEYLIIEMADGSLYYERRNPDPSKAAGPAMITHRSLMKKAVADGAGSASTEADGTEQYRLQMKVLGDFSVMNGVVSAVSNRSGSVPHGVEAHTVYLGQRLKDAGLSVDFEHVKKVDVAQELRQAKADGRTPYIPDLGHVDAEQGVQIERELYNTMGYSEIIPEIEEHPT